MDNLDVAILNVIQEGIPLEYRPFKTVGEKLGITENEVITRINNLKANGSIRKVGGIFNSRKLGYIGTLCGMKVPKEKIEVAAHIVNSFPEVTHNYLRDDSYNMWFTIVSNSKDGQQRILEGIKSKTGIEGILNLPSKKLFKVKAAFKLGGE
ncbi:MAG: AsnC family transcriptional regulator [Bacillota bacterium]|nr:AsnC family transcriptional regulator [Bacillota bacterium]